VVQVDAASVFCAAEAADLGGEVGKANGGHAGVELGPAFEADIVPPSAHGDGLCGGR